MANRVDIIIDLLTKQNEALSELKKVERQSKKTEKEVEKGLGGAFKKAGQSAKSLGDSLGRIKASTVALGTALSAAFAGFVGGSIVRAAIEQEDAINRLNSALKTSGDFSEAASQDLQKYASELQRVSVFGDEVILNQLALAKSFGASNDQAKQVIQAAIDLSAAFGIDLESATRNVAKTLGGYAGELGETIPALKALTQEQLQAGEGIALIARRFSGEGLRATTTFSGAIKQLTNLFGDNLEQIGLTIIQNKAFIRLIKATTKALADFGKELEKLDPESLTAVFTGSLKGIALFLKAIGLVTRSIDTLLTGVATGITSLTSGIFIAASKITSFFNTTFGRSNQQQLDNITEATQILNAAIKDLSDTSRQRNGIEQLGDSFDKFAESLKDTNVEIEKLSKNTQNLNLETINVPGVSRPDGFQGVGGSGLGDLRGFEEGRQAAEDFQNALASRFFTDFKIRLEQNIESVFARLATAFTRGRAGAKELITSLGGAVADAFVPGLGGPVKEILGLLAEGPDKVRETVQEFFRAIPEIIENILVSLPVLIEELSVGLAELPARIAERSDEIVTGFINGFIRGLPRIIQAQIESFPRLVSAFIKQIPNIVDGFIFALKEGAPDFIQALIDAVRDGFGNAGDLLGDAGGSVGGALGDVGGFLGDIGSTIGGAIGKVGDVFGFAQGGEIRGGLPGRDSVPALLTPGELVVDRSTTGDLKDSIVRTERMELLLGEILQSVSRPQSITTEVNLNNRTFAELILELNRDNQRIA